MRRIDLGSSLLALMLAIGSAGCCEKLAEKAAAKAVEEATGGDASLAFGNDVDISDLPAAFRYPGAKGKGRFAQNMPTGAGTAYILESDDPVGKVKAHYAVIGGYKQVLKMDTTDGTMYNYEDASGAESFHVTVVPSGGKTGITVVHTKNKP